MITTKTKGPGRWKEGRKEGRSATLHGRRGGRGDIIDVLTAWRREGEARFGDGKGCHAQESFD